MGTNNFKVFNEGFSNSQSDAQYLADAQRLGGVVPGVAPSALHNKMYRQSTIMAAAIGQVIADRGYNASDADLAALIQALKDALVTPAITAFLNRQVLINAGCEICQRIVPFGSLTLATAASAYVIDRIKSFNNGSGANATVSQVAVSDLDGATSGVQIVHAATPTTGGQLGHVYTVEAKDSYKLAGQQVVYALKIKGVGAMDRITVNARYKTTESAISSSSTLVGSSGAQPINNLGWVIVPVVVTLPIRATLTTSGVIGFEVVASKTTAEASGDGFVMTEIELIKANADLGFQPRSFADEDLLCRRFNYRISSANSTMVFGVGQALSSTAAQVFIPISQRMRLANPTLTMGGTFRLYSGLTPITVTGITLNTSTGRFDGVLLDITVASGLTAGNAVILTANADATAFLNFDSEL